MSRERFAELLEKYHQGKCTPREKKFVEYWFGLVETSNEASDLDLKEIEDRIWNRMQDAAPDLEATPIVPLRRIVIKWMSIAAAFLLVTWFVLKDRFETKGVPTGIAMEERKNNTDTNLEVTLEDGSIVSLSPQSTLRYPGHFEKTKRTVFLSGKGFFQIQKNPDKPFYVHSGDIVTKVLGTSFYVETKAQGGKPEVEVVSGLVSVYNAKKFDEKSHGDVLVKPNQQTTFDPATGSFVTTLSKKPHLIDANVSFRFRNAPLSMVMKRIATGYGVEINAANPRVVTCPLTADLTGQPLFVQLDIICAALNASYRVRGTAITITGKGCKI